MRLTNFFFSHILIITGVPTRALLATRSPTRRVRSIDDGSACSKCSKSNAISCRGLRAIALCVKLCFSPIESRAVVPLSKGSEDRGPAAFSLSGARAQRLRRQRFDLQLTSGQTQRSCAQSVGKTLSVATSSEVQTMSRSDNVRGQLTRSYEGVLCCERLTVR